MAGLTVRLEPVSRERVAPGEAAVVATFVNAGEEAELFNDHLAQHGSLVLQVEDESGRRLLLPPPTPPDERDRAPGRPLAPGESVTIRYGGFLDAYAESGRYRVRYFTNQPRLGGSPLVPLMSDWVVVDVVQPSFVPPVRRTWLDFARDPPAAVRRLLEYIWQTILRLNCRAVLEEEVDVYLTQTTSYEGHPEWNQYHGWHARFHVQVNQPEKRTYATIRIRLNGPGSSDPLPWGTAIAAAWGNRFKSCVDLRCSPNGYPILVAIAWVWQNEHHVVNVTSATKSMLDWAIADTVAVRHEVGHMLGNKDEYATIDGVYYGPNYQPTGNIMNNPANPPVAAHYRLIQQTLEALLSVKWSLRGKPAKPVSQSCA